MRSRAILQELQRHFREFLQVEDESGKVFFFRFYDPRVLGLYLPTCTPLELRTIFGSVGRFCLEGADAGSLRELELDGLKLKQRVVHLAPDPTAASAPTFAPPTLLED